MRAITFHSFMLDASEHSIALILLCSSWSVEEREDQLYFFFFLYHLLLD